MMLSILHCDIEVNLQIYINLPCPVIWSNVIKFFLHTYIIWVGHAYLFPGLSISKQLMQLFVSLYAILLYENDWLWQTIVRIKQVVNMYTNVRNDARVVPGTDCTWFLQTIFPQSWRISGSIRIGQIFSYWSKYAYVWCILQHNYNLEEYYI